MTMAGVTAAVPESAEAVAIPAPDLQRVAWSLFAALLAAEAALALAFLR